MQLDHQSINLFCALASGLVSVWSSVFLTTILQRER